MNFFKVLIHLLGLLGLSRESFALDEPDIFSILAELEALHTENVNIELERLQIFEKILFDFFVQSECGNGRDLDLIRTINRIDEDATAFQSVNQLRRRVFQTNGFTPAQVYCFSQKSLLDRFQIMYKKMQIVNLVQDDTLKTSVYQEIRKITSLGSIIGKMFSLEVDISYTEMYSIVTQNYVIEPDPFGSVTYTTLVEFRDYQLAPETYELHVGKLARMMVQIPEAEMDVVQVRILCLKYFRLNSISTLQFENWSYGDHFQLLSAKLEIVKRVESAERTSNIVTEISSATSVVELESIEIGGNAVWTTSDTANLPSLKLELNGAVAVLSSFVRKQPLSDSSWDLIDLKLSRKSFVGTAVNQYQEAMQTVVETIVDEVDLPHSEIVAVLLPLFSSQFTIEIYKAILADHSPELTENIVAAEQMSQVDVLWENSGMSVDMGTIPIVTRLSHTNSQSVIVKMFSGSSKELQYKISLAMHHFYPTSAEFGNGAIQQLKMFILPFLSDEEAGEFRTISESDMFVQSCLMFNAVLIMEERNIQYSQIAETVSQLVVAEKFDASIISFLNPPDFDEIRETQQQIFDFGYGYAKTLIADYFHISLNDEAATYQVKVAMQTTSVITIKQDLVAQVGSELQLKIFQIVQTDEFDQIWRRAVLLDTLEQDSAILSGTALEDALKTLVYSEDQVGPETIPEINVAKIVGMVVEAKTSKIFLTEYYDTKE